LQLFVNIVREELVLFEKKLMNNSISLFTFDSTQYTKMMKLAISALLAGSAAAFAPAFAPRATTSLNAFESELGAQEPLGFYVSY